MGKPHTVIQGSVPTLRTWVRALRLHQWSKNGLLFVPLLTAHRMFDADAVFNVIAGFLAFGFVASAGYIINDLMDLESDRHHTTKRYRPFASGNLTIKSGLIACALLLLGGFSISLTLSLGFLTAISVYFASTVLYSLWLKQIASLDVLVLAGLYTVRVIAGAFAAGVSLSFWLLAFALFMFLCLALVKRVAELVELAERKQESHDEAQGRARGRGYYTLDVPVLQSLGSSSGYMAVLVLALYINSPDVTLLYATPEVLWVIVPLLLLWVTRVWVVTARGYMLDDPIVFAIKDPETWLTAGATALVLGIAAMVTI